MPEGVPPLRIGELDQLKVAVGCKLTHAISQSLRLPKVRMVCVAYLPRLIVAYGRRRSVPHVCAVAAYAGADKGRYGESFVR